MQIDVAVLVAAYNAEATIETAIESVLAGARPCHVYVVDDASLTPVSTFLKRFGDDVTVIRLDKNVGPASARNVGLEAIMERGFHYVAIQDADDISYPTRLAIQAEFLDRHPEVGAVGTWTRLFDEHTNETVRINRRATAPEAVRASMFFNIGLSHASAMMRLDALRRVGFYSEQYPAAEDYELLRRIGQKYQLANVPECLLHYRISSGGQSLRRRKRQLYDRLRVQFRYFEVGNARAWAGIMQTMLLFLLPTGLLQALKARIFRA